MTQRTTITDEIVYLDYRTFEGVDFIRCALVYKGGGVPYLKGNYFDQCTWHFEDSALRTVQFLRNMTHGSNNATLTEFFKAEILGLTDA